MNRSAPLLALPSVVAALSGSRGGVARAAGTSLVSESAEASPQYQLRYLGDPVLRQRAAAIASRGDISIGLLAAMRDVLRTKGGRGLAAPQVGASVRLIVVSIERTKSLHAFVNPRIVFASPETHRHLAEGCLSIPGFYTNVVRHLHVVVEYEDLDLDTHTHAASGTEAFAFQHEIDHLDGKLLVDGLSRQQQRQAARAVAKATGGAQ